MIADEFVITVYDKALNRLGWVGAPDLLVCTPRANLQGSALITLRHTDKMAGWLSVDGVRVTVHYRDEYTLGGPVRLIESKGAAAARALTFEVLDDWRLWQRLLLLVNPTGNLTQQGDDEALYADDGPAESVAKRALQRNVTRALSTTSGTGRANRFTQPITVATDQGRGGTIALRARMVPLADPLVPLVDRAGLVLTVRQTLTGLTADVREPVVWSQWLSEDSGTLVGNEWTRTPPEATAVLVAGVNADDTPRYRYVADAALEQRFGDVVERFEPARDVKVGDGTEPDPGLTAAQADIELDARALQYLAEYGVKAGLNLTLAETSRFRYGGATGPHVGDTMRVELEPERVMRTPTGVVTLPPARVTDRLRSCVLTWAPDGTTALPQVGERSDTEATTAKILARLLAGLRATRAGS